MHKSTHSGDPVSPSLTFRCYLVRELAQIYWPYASCPQNAVRNLRSAIWSDPSLAAQLQAAGYHKHIRHLTPRMVSIIAAELGTPEEFHDIKGWV